MLTSRTRKGRQNITNTKTTGIAATVAEHGAAVAPDKASSKKGAGHKKDAPKTKKNAKVAAPKKEATNKSNAKSERKAAAPRAKSKGAKIRELIGRARGATLGEIMKVTNWQAHSVRGFISTAGKKHSITIESSKSEAGDRIYTIAK